VIKEQEEEEEEGGFGLLSQKNQGEMTEDESMDSMSSSPDNSMISFLKQQGFKDWSGGKSYGMNFHYISRKPSTPANLTMVVGQDKDAKPNTCDITILFDDKIEKANRYKNYQEYLKMSSIPKIEKVLGVNFDMTEKGTQYSFSLQAFDVPLDKAKQAVTLFNQIRLKGPYGGV
jgi:hypothetical protein